MSLNRDQAEPHGRKNDGPLVRVVIADDHEPTRVLLRTLLEFDARCASSAALQSGGQRPATRVILHTAHAESIKHARAAALGLPLLVKQGFDETVAAAGATFDPAEQDAPGPEAVDAIVRAALGAHGHRPMVVVSADQMIPFYNVAAAELLDLPIPAKAMTLAELREAHPLVDRLGQPVAVEESPLQRALAGESGESGELSELRPDGVLRTYHLNVVPLRAPDGRFLGVASFMTVLAETRPVRSAVNAQ